MQSIVKPPANQPEKGILDVAVKFSNTCSTDFDNPDRTTISDFVRECLKKVLFHANVIDLNELCLIPRKHVWKIEMEIICLNLNGSILDLSLLAAICALKYCMHCYFIIIFFLLVFIVICLVGKLRKYEVDLDFDIITPTETFDNLQVNCYPTFSTFCIIDE